MSKVSLMARLARARSLIPAPVTPRLRSFSAAAGGEVQPDPSAADDPFLQSTQGSIFARVTTFSDHTLKTDIIHLFEGCNLSPADVKLTYNDSYRSKSMILRFPSESDLGLARQKIIERGRLYRLDQVDRSVWEILPSYDGRYVLLEGIPRSTLPEDIERFLAGSNFEPNFQITTRATGRRGIFKYAVVRFQSSLDAVSAFLTKNNSFILNNRITMRILQ